MRMLLLACLALGGCGPLTMHYREGVSVARLAEDELRCETSALRGAPVANQTQQDPPVFIPPRKVCDRAGACTTHGGYWQPGRIYTVDVNRDLRGRLLRSCMSAKGYTQVDIPRCKSGVRVSGRMTVLPPLTPRSCAVIGESGGESGAITIIEAPS